MKNKVKLKTKKNCVKKGFHASLEILIIFSLLVTPATASPTNFQLALTKGTYFTKVILFNNTEWEATIGNSTSPVDWFGGEANITGAMSKFTLKGYVDISWKAYDIISTIVLEPKDIPNLIALSQYGYNETEINNKLPITINLWYGLMAKWEFSINDFNNTPDNAYAQVFVLKNPEQYGEIVSIYNDFVTLVKNDSSVPIFLKTAFSKITGEDLLWKIALNGFATANPIGNYINAVINGLNCTNVTSSSNKLIFQFKQPANYSVEFIYNERGLMTSLEIKSEIGQIIYKIIEIDQSWIFYLLLSLFLGIPLIGLTFYLLISRKRRKKR